MGSGVEVGLVDTMWDDEHIECAYDHDCGGSFEQCVDGRCIRLKAKRAYANDDRDSVPPRTASNSTSTRKPGPVLPHGSEVGSVDTQATNGGRPSVAHYQGVSGRVTGGTPTTDPFSPPPGEWWWCGECERRTWGEFPECRFCGMNCDRWKGEDGTSGYPPKRSDGSRGVST